MIRTNALFEEYSLWDTKVIREHLVIPEDELNVLRSLPEWSRKEDTIPSIGKDADVETSQSSNILFATVSEKNQKLYKQNLDLFKEKSEILKSLLEANEEYLKVPNRSSSLRDISKIDQKLSHTNLLKSSSVPNICLHTENILSKMSGMEYERKSIEEKKLSLVKDTFLASRNIGISKISSQTLESKNETFTEKLPMNVIFQMPVVSTNYVDKTESKKASFEKYVDCKTLPTFKSLSNSLDNHSLLTKDINSSKSISDTNEEVSVVNSSVSLNSSETNVKVSCFVKDIVLNNSENLNLNIMDKATKLTESQNSSENNDIMKTKVSDKIKDNFGLNEKSNKLCQPKDPNLCKSGSDLSNAKETFVDHNCDFGVNAKNIKSAKNPNENLFDEKKTVTDGPIISSAEKEIDMADQKLVEMNVFSNKSVESLNTAKEVYASKTNLIANELDKITCSSHASKIVAIQPTIQEEVDKSMFAPKLSSKRKLESKSKSSKKHRSNLDKEGNFDKRSLKNAGKICYSVESVKTMLNIMKTFVDI